MAQSLAKFEGRILLITSGQDLTAAEFNDVAAASSAWQAVLSGPFVERRVLEDANHTFSSPEWKRQVERWTAEWLRSW